MSRRYRYHPMTAEEFTDTLKAAGYSHRTFSYDHGFNEARVLKWMNGQEDVPQNAASILAMAQADGAMERAVLEADKRVMRDEDGNPIFFGH